jgi:hypothetical protein
MAWLAGRHIGRTTLKTRERIADALAGCYSLMKPAPWPIKVKRGLISAREAIDTLRKERGLSGIAWSSSSPASRT